MALNTDGALKLAIFDKSVGIHAKRSKYGRSYITDRTCHCRRLAVILTIISSTAVMPTQGQRLRKYNFLQRDAAIC